MNSAWCACLFFSIFDFFTNTADYRIRIPAACHQLMASIPVWLPASMLAGISACLPAFLLLASIPAWLHSQHHCLSISIPASIPGKSCLPTPACQIHFYALSLFHLLFSRGVFFISPPSLTDWVLISLVSCVHLYGRYHDCPERKIAIFLINADAFTEAFSH